MPEQKQFLDFRGLQLYHQKIMAEISNVKDEIPTISVNDTEENLIIVKKGETKDPTKLRYSYKSRGGAVWRASDEVAAYQNKINVEYDGGE